MAHEWGLGENAAVSMESESRKRKSLLCALSVLVVLRVMELTLGAVVSPIEQEQEQEEEEAESDPDAEEREDAGRRGGRALRRRICKLRRREGKGRGGKELYLRNVGCRGGSLQRIMDTLKTRSAPPCTPTLVQEAIGRAHSLSRCVEWISWSPPALRRRSRIPSRRLATDRQTDRQDLYVRTREVVT